MSRSLGKWIMKYEMEAIVGTDRFDTALIPTLIPITVMADYGNEVLVTLVSGVVEHQRRVQKNVGGLNGIYDNYAIAAQARAEVLDEQVDAAFKRFAEARAALSRGAVSPQRVQKAR